MHTFNIPPISQLSSPGKSSVQIVQFVGDDTPVGDKSSQQFALLLRVTQSNGRPLPVSGFTSQVMSQMFPEITGVVPREVLIMNDQEVVMEFKEGTPMIEVS